MIAFGAERSWSGVGQVNALAGDVILVNPGELHDGAPLDGAIQAGFADQSHMTRAFVRQIGITPVRYRGACTRTPSAFRWSLDT